MSDLAQNAEYEEVFGPVSSYEGLVMVSTSAVSATTTSYRWSGKLYWADDHFELDTGMVVHTIRMWRKRGSPLGREVASSLIDRLSALARMEHSDFSIGDEAADEIRRLEERVRCFEESLEICLGPQSPLPPLAKDVVRGAFITTAKRRGEQ